MDCRCPRDLFDMGPTWCLRDCNIEPYSQEPVENDAAPGCDLSGTIDTFRTLLISFNGFVLYTDIEPSRLCIRARLLW